MKLLMTTDTVGGVFTYATQLVSELERFGVEVVLATQGGALAEDQRAALARLQNVTLYESAYRLEWMENPWEDVDAAGRWLRWIAQREQPDLIHLNDYSHAALGWDQPVMVVAHSCVYSWFRAVRREDPGPRWRTYRRRVAAGLRSASLVVAPTAAMLASVDETYGPLRRRRVIPNGRAPLCRGVEKEPLVLAAGRVWDEAKNIAALARSADALRWPVYVAGECRHPDGGQCEIPGVRFLGRLSSERLAEWYARAAIYALPARYEPFGLTPLEAALGGCALVLGDIPSLREVWGEAALFVDPFDDAQLAGALDRLSEDASLRAAMARRAHARARRMTADRMMRGYLKAYQQLLRGVVPQTVGPPVLEEA